MVHGEPEEGKKLFHGGDFSHSDADVIEFGFHD
jgi:hypothetical protein